MIENIEQIKQDIITKVNSIDSMKKINELKVEYTGKKGIITEIQSKIKDIPVEQKKEYGKLVNELKNLFNELIETKSKEINEKEINTKLESEAIDISLPATKLPVGAPNVVEKTIEEVE